MSIDINDAYPPKWLNKDNVDALISVFGYLLTIASVRYELVGEKKEQAVVWRFKEITQGFVAKKPHHLAGVALHGENTNAWVGKRVQIRRNPKYGVGVGETGLIVLAPPVAGTDDAGADDVPF
jgi:hypothetical protein